MDWMFSDSFWMYFYGTIVNWTTHYLYDSDHGLERVASTLISKRIM